MIQYEVMEGTEEDAVVWLLLRCELGVATVIGRFPTAEKAAGALDAVRAGGEQALGE